jgi:hypothetical protein
VWRGGRTWECLMRMKLLLSWLVPIQNMDDLFLICMNECSFLYIHLGYILASLHVAAWYVAQTRVGKAWHKLCAIPSYASLLLLMCCLWRDLSLFLTTVIVFCVKETIQSKI